MSYFPGGGGAVSFERKALVWSEGEEEHRVPWAEIRLVETAGAGATVHFGDRSLLLPRDIMWFEFVIEDIIEKARAANPGYEGPPPTTVPRSLALPSSHQERLNYARRAQRFYRDRCPSYQEFKAFLEANPDWVFDESSFYECSLSLCSGSPVGEGFSTDLKIPKSARWYTRFEKASRGRRLSGRKLLEILSSIEPPP